MTISVARNTHKKEPIILSSEQENNIEIILDEGACATVYDARTDLQQSNKRSISITIHDDAQLNYVYEHKIDDPKKTSITITLHENSTLNFSAAIYGSLNLTIVIYLEKPGASVNCAGFYVLKNEQECIITTRQLHRARNTESTVLFNGVLYDGAQAQYRGTIAIEKSAQHSKAVQKNKNLLFGHRARALSIPNMEVKTNEVQCSHGSAVGRFDREQLFYMQSRGFSVNCAQHLLIEAFLSEVFALLPHEMRSIAKSEKQGKLFLLKQ